jgi:hypothetical protein
VKADIRKGDASGNRRIRARDDAIGRMWRIKNLTVWMKLFSAVVDMDSLLSFPDKEIRRV